MKKTSKYYRAVYHGESGTDVEVFVDLSLESAVAYAQTLNTSGRTLYQVTEHERECDAMVPDDGETNN